ncbi:hypothetical protein [Sulfitobacter sp. PS-8MA]|uniref:hypothetical protein n=1 Tax=Sulfitobacter sp. PS-8MA TaxID=3237707 RepID=UPI0034C62FF6
MTPSQRIHQLEQANAKLRRQVDTQETTICFYRRKFMDAKRKLAKERGRNAPLQNMVDYYRALSCPIQQAERLFKDGET